MASIVPSTKAGFATRMVMVKNPIKNPKIHRPGLVPGALTGSVAMKDMPNKKPPAQRWYKGPAFSQESLLPGIR